MVPMQVLRYYCSKCSSLLKESPVELSASPSDICPQCGSFLAETLRRETPASAIRAEAPAPRTVSDLSVPGFGIPELDSLAIRFASSVCITGRSSELLFWRALVRSFLPRRSGGSGFSRVLLIDAGNCSDIYLCMDFARQVGLSLDALLDGIVVTRAFTVYQLASLAGDLVHAVKRVGAQMVAIADMARMFADDPQVASEERVIARRIAGSISCVADIVPVMAFMSSSFRSADWLTAFDSLLRVQNMEGKRLTISMHKGKEKASVTVKENDVLLLARQD